jgi:hypothetical protein
MDIRGGASWRDRNFFLVVSAVSPAPTYLLILNDRIMGKQCMNGKPLFVAVEVLRATAWIPFEISEWYFGQMLTFECHVVMVCTPLCSFVVIHDYTSIRQQPRVYQRLYYLAYVENRDDH